MIIIRARACIKCHEYVFIHPNSIISQEIEKNFDKKHSGHTIVTVDLEEIKGQYKNCELAEI